MSVKILLSALYGIIKHGAVGVVKPSVIQTRLCCVKLHEEYQFRWGCRLEHETLMHLTFTATETHLVSLVSYSAIIYTSSIVFKMNCPRFSD
jgi:hypothetical protein